MAAPGPVSRRPPSCPRGTHCPSVQTLTPPCVPALAWLCPLSHCPGAFLSYDSALFWTSHSFKPRLEPGVLWGWWRAAQGPLQPSGHLWGLRIKTWPLVSQGQCGGRGGACAGRGGTPSQTHISSDRNNKEGRVLEGTVWGQGPCGLRAHQALRPGEGRPVPRQRGICLDPPAPRSWLGREAPSLRVPSLLHAPRPRGRARTQARPLWAPPPPADAPRGWTLGRGRAGPHVIGLSQRPSGP